MARYTYSQIEQLWIQYGGNAQAAPIAAAVAMSESGGDSQATNHNTNGSIDVGLFQINSVHGSQATYDLAGNIRAAIGISQNGSSWKPWCTTWTNGCSGTYAPTAPNTPSGKQYAIGGGSSGNVLVPNASPASTISGNPLTGEFWTHLIDVVGNWSFYVGLIAAGGILAFIGFALLAKDTGAGRATVSGIRTAAKVVPFL